MADNRTIAENIVNAVGGKENISSATHCMTRLRLTLVDEGKANDEEVKKLDGVLGVVHAGGQYQVIVGQNVPKVYNEVVGHCGVNGGGLVEEDAGDKPKEKITFKGVFTNVMNYLSGSLTPLIPILIGAAMFKTVLSILGPDMLKLFTAESDVYKLLDFVYDAGFYFLPIYIGYSAAKKLNASPVLGMFLGGILLAPDFMAMANEGTAFTVFGIPCSVNNYSQSVLPIILSVYVMSHVEKLFKKYIPDALSTIFVPFLTVLVMLPISLCALAPLGAFLGQYVSGALIAFGNVGGFVAVAVIAAVWEYLVMSGMHIIMVVTVLNIYMTTGSEAVIWPAALCATAAVFGMAFGAFLRVKDKKEKSLCLGYFISGIIGGVTEPALYGIGFKYKKPFLGYMIGAAAGGLYVGITHSVMYALGATNFLMVLSFSGGSAANLINGTIGCVIAMLVAAVATYLIGFDEKQ
ncbi:MAG: PTS transporter subunit EIIC [Erysipelotrichaceae bacterium]|nr:PTS transporter subunit EIIC [Erysipelotrichaceae bacterium]